MNNYSDKCSIHTTEKMLYTVQEAATILSIGKNLAYELIKEGKIKTVQLGGFKVSRGELERFIYELQQCA